MAVITIWSKKGGVGKTSLAYNLARDLKSFLITNDDSIVEIAYPDKSKIMKHPKLIDDVVYDFGGFVDDSIKNILDNSDLIIVPMINDLNSFKKTISTLNDVDNKKVLIVANRAVKNDFRDIEEYFKKRNLKVLELPESKIFKKAFSEKKSINEIVNANKFNKYTYRNIADKYNQILNYIKGVTKWVLA